MNRETTKTTSTFSIDIEVLKKFKKECEKENRKYSNVLEDLMKYFLKN